MSRLAHNQQNRSVTGDRNQIHGAQEIRWAKESHSQGTSAMLQFPVLVNMISQLKAVMP